MKTIKRFLLLTICVSMFTACTPYDIFIDDEYVTVTMPFEADYSVWDHSDYTDNQCGGHPIYFLTMIGEGEILHLGHMTTTMTFCVDVSTGYYYGTVGSFVFDNGDELFFEVPEGQIFPNIGDDADYYQTRFDDDMFFTGGTGRFQTATGDATSNAFVHDGADEWRTDFFSEGTLMFRKRKR